VAGTVVCSARGDGVRGPTFLLVRQCSTRGEATGEWMVALDGVGAGTGEVVIVSQGPSARQTPATNQKPVDALVCGIVDLVDERGAIAFRKG
jgi:microcompartment protein CcmK/EutM